MKKIKLVLIMLVLLCTCAVLASCTNKHYHKYSYTTTVEATCETDGVKLGVCSCGVVTQRVITAKGHNWDHEELVYDEAYGKTTCVFSGRKVRTCTVCDYQESVYDELLEHDIVNGVCANCGYDVYNSYTYKTYTSSFPTNWGEWNYQTKEDAQIIEYITSPFFEANFVFDENGNIIPEKYTINYSFATALEDVTSDYVGKFGVNVGDSAKVWKITIRSDGKWDTGEAIVAGDFVYSMQEKYNPLFQNASANSFIKKPMDIYGTYEYSLQGKTAIKSAREKYSSWAEAKNDNSLYFDLESPYSGIMQWAIHAGYGSYVNGKGGQWLWSALMSGNAQKLQGKTWEEISSNEELFKLWQSNLAIWKTQPDEELDFFCYKHTYPEYSWDNVGMWAPSDREIIIALTNPVEFLDEDGNLSYNALYELGRLPLVHKTTYEACKVAPKEGGGLWTSTYNTTAQNTRSWGPYRMLSFQSDKYYCLIKNNNWYGYSLAQYEGQYQTNRIECEKITDYETAFLKFLEGDLTTVNADVSNLAELKDSERANFTANDYVQSIYLQTDNLSLKEKELSGVNKTILSYKYFRKAISLFLDRTAYNKEVSASGIPAFGLFGPSHYYNVANGGVYRNTDVAKKALCDAYFIDVEDYSSLNDAYSAISNRNIDLAKGYLERAYNEALSRGDIRQNDRIILTFGAPEDNEFTRRNYNFIKNALESLAVSTSLEGRLTCEFNPTFGARWKEAFLAGEYDICVAGISGCAWDIGYLLNAYLNPEVSYSPGWNTNYHIVSITVHGVKAVNGNLVVTNNANDTYTADLSLYDEWYKLLNNEFRQGVLADEFRLEIIAELEKVILDISYAIPISYGYDTSLLSYQVEHGSTANNALMQHGGIRYLTYNFNDADWQKVKGDYKYVK